MSRLGWISDDELPDIVALAQSAPGLLAVNMSIFAGYKMRGLAGSIVATIGCCIAPFLFILAIAMAFTSFKDSPVVQRIFMGIRPVVISLIIVPALNMAKRNTSWWAWAITIGVFLAVVFLKFSPTYILLTIIVIAAAVAYYRGRRTK